jgi:hypothetical protein
LPLLSCCCQNCCRCLAAPPSAGHVVGSMRPTCPLARRHAPRWRPPPHSGSSVGAGRASSRQRALTRAHCRS